MKNYQIIHCHELKLMLNVSELNLVGKLVKIQLQESITKKTNKHVIKQI